MAGYRQADGRFRPILNVRIVDDLTGEELADVDAPSTADALAYYLSSRGIAPDATEDSVASGPAWENLEEPLTGRETLVWEQRGIFGELHRAIFAEVH